MDAAVSFPTTPKPVKATRPKLSKRMNVEQAFETIVRCCVEQIRANQDGVARFHHAESVHQMRVGLRRLDAALTLFGDAVCIPKDIEHEAGWLMDELGTVRDWDVLVESTLPRISSTVPGQDALNEVRSAAGEKLQHLHHKVAAAVGSERFRRLVEGIDSWVQQRGWREGLSMRQKTRLKLRVPHCATAILEQERERLQKRGAKLKGGDEKARHRVRIAAKRSRYAAEFFASLYPGKQVRPYVQALSALQDHLGALNDAAVAGRLLEELAGDAVEVREGSAMVRGYLAALGVGGEPKARKLWKRFTPIRLPH